MGKLSRRHFLKVFFSGGLALYLPNLPNFLGSNDFEIFSSDETSEGILNSDNLTS